MERPQTLHLHLDNDVESASTSKIPKSILKTPRSTSSERLSDGNDDETSGFRKSGPGSIRRLRSLPVGTTRPRVYREPRLASHNERFSGNAEVNGHEEQSTPSGRRLNRRASSKSRIPKLSVSWETNSVAGEAPLAQDFDGHGFSDDDTSSVCSHGSGMGSISQNWQGRSTRYVPHCAKRHMHRNDNPEDYLTPTQRKNRLIADLRKELRGLHKMVADKDRHVEQLRERLGELEGVLDQGGFLTENHRLMARISLLQDQHRKEKEQLVQKYEQKIKKMKQNAPQETDLTDEGLRESKPVELTPPPPEVTPGSDVASVVPSDPVESPRTASAMMTLSATRLEYLLGTPSLEEPVQRTNVGVMTEPDQLVMDLEGKLREAQEELGRQQEESSELQQRVNELEVTDARIYELEHGMTHHMSTVGSTGEHVVTPGQRSTSTHESLAGGREAELVAQLEAYKGECIIWRTRASEIELAAREAQEHFDGIAAAKDTEIEALNEAKAELNEMKRNAAEGECSNPLCLERLERLEDLEEAVDHFQQTNSRSVPMSERASPAPPGSGRQSTGPESVDRSFDLTPRSPSLSLTRRSGKRYSDASLGLQTLTQEMELQTKLLEAEKDQLHEKVQELENTIVVKSEELQTCVTEINDVRRELHNSKTSLEVAEITMERMREDNLRLQEQIKTLADKIQKIENSGIAVPVGDDSGVAVTPSQLKKRSRYNIVETVSRQLQTALAGSDIEAKAGQLGEIKVAFEELSERYEIETADYRERLKQMSENLTVKNSLAETLNRQLCELQEAYEESRARWSEEREVFGGKIAELTPVAQRVPTLEGQLSDAQAELSQVITRHRSEKEKMEQALEQSLANSLAASQASEAYWQEKVRELETEVKTLKTKSEKAGKDLQDGMVRLNVEKTRLENDVGAKSNEIKELHAFIYRERTHSSMQTMDLGIDKSVECLPELYDAETDILEGDLYDEKAESIKVLQGELTASRRQIQILDEKLADFVRVASSEKDEKVSNLMKLLENHQKELENLKMARISDIGEKSKLEDRVEELRKERDMLKRKGKENIERLEEEFQLVQKELQSVVQRYENEKHRVLKKLRSAQDDNDILRWKHKVLRQEILVMSNSYGTGGKGGADGQERLRKLEAIMAKESPIDPSEILMYEETGSLDSASQLDLQTAVQTEEGTEPGGVCAARAPGGVLGSMMDSGISELVASQPGSPAKLAAAAVARAIRARKTVGLAGDSEEHQRESGDSSSGDASAEPSTEARRIETRICSLADQVIDENTTLRDGLEGLREKVNVLLQDTKRSKVKAKAKVGKGKPRILENLESPDLAESGSEADSESKVRGSSLSSEGESSSRSVDMEVKLEELKEGLRTVLEDQSRITAAASNVAQTAQASLAADSKFEKLERWLQADIQQEKLELEAVCQWYEKDKYKLGDALRNARKEISNLSKERDCLSDLLRDMQSQLETLNDLYREVTREICLMKAEDAQRMEQRLQEKSIISKSDSDVRGKGTEEEEKWKGKVGTIYKEKVLLEKRFKAARYEKVEADRNLVMLRGELEVVKAAYETERDKLLAKITDLTGEVWTEEASANYVRELQQNLEIKKQELFDLSARYETDVRQLHEELYAERAKRMPSEMGEKIERIRLHLSSEQGVDAASNVTNVSNASGSSKILLKREMEREHAELVILKNELSDERGKFEDVVKSLHGKLRISSSILSEKEQLIKIMEGEIFSLQTALDEEQLKREQDVQRLKSEIEHLNSERKFLKQKLESLPSDSPVSLVELERSWKEELKHAHEEYGAEVRSLKQDLMLQHDRFENYRRVTSGKLKACSNMLTEKENNVKILERELRSIEDGLSAQKAKTNAVVKESSSKINELKVLLARNNISAPPTPRKSPTPDPQQVKVHRVRLESTGRSASEDLSVAVRRELETYRASYENLRQIGYQPDEPRPAVSEQALDTSTIAPSITVEYVSRGGETSTSTLNSDSEGCAILEQPGGLEPPLCVSCGGHMVSSSTDPETSSGEECARCSTLFSGSGGSRESLANLAALSSCEESVSMRTDSAHTATDHEFSPPVDPYSKSPDQSAQQQQQPRVHAVDAEMKVIRLTKELNMVNSELEVTRDRFFEDKRKWLSENANLKEKVAEMEQKLGEGESLRAELVEEIAKASSIMAANEGRLEAERKASDQTLPKPGVTEMAVQTLPESDSGGSAVYHDVETEIVDLPKPGTSEIGLQTIEMPAIRKVLESLPSLPGSSQFLSEVGVQTEPESRQPQPEVPELTENDKTHLQLELAASKAELNNVLHENEEVRSQLDEMKQELCELKGEMVEKETQHQAMYMTMFQKGQEVAMAEALDMGSSEEYHTAHPPQEWNVKDMEALVHSQFHGSEADLPATPSSGHVTDPNSAHGSDGAGHERPLTHVSPTRRLKATRSAGHDSGLTKEEILLRFLRDAVYYFMINRDPKDHLFAIMNILKFSEQQRTDVLKTKGLH